MSSASETVITSDKIARASTGPHIPGEAAAVHLQPLIQPRRRMMARLCVPQPTILSVKAVSATHLCTTFNPRARRQLSPHEVRKISSSFVSPSSSQSDAGSSGGTNAGLTCSAMSDGGPESRSRDCGGACWLAMAWKRSHNVCPLCAPAVDTRAHHAPHAPSATASSVVPWAGRSVRNEKVRGSNP